MLAFQKSVKNYINQKILQTQQSLEMSYKKN